PASSPAAMKLLRSERITRGKGSSSSSSTKSSRGSLVRTTTGTSEIKCVSSSLSSAVKESMTNGSSSTGSSKAKRSDTVTAGTASGKIGSPANDSNETASKPVSSSVSADDLGACVTASVSSPESGTTSSNPSKI